jgi:hypothetical protein
MFPWSRRDVPPEEIGGLISRSPWEGVPSCETRTACLPKAGQDLGETRLALATRKRGRQNQPLYPRGSPDESPSAGEALRGCG